MKPKITAIILTKNEASMIEGCLKTLRWCDELLVIDDNSTDETVENAENLGARVMQFSHPSFARKRNEAIKHAQGDWLLYIDADERITPTLAKEILVNIETGEAAALTFRRENYCYGHQFHHGGWGKDLVTRVFRKEALREWNGDIHESPVYKGDDLKLHSPLLHFTHRSTEENLQKSADWTKKEATLLFKAGLKPVRFLTLIRKGVMEFFRRAIVKQGYRDGLAGLIEALVQAMNRVMVYIQVWELQQKPPIAERYTEKEKQVQQLWQQEKGL